MAFYVLAFLVTWAGWVPDALHSHGLIPFAVPFGYLAGVGPGIAALIVLRACHGRDGTRRLARSLLAWRVPVRWYAIALGGPAAVWAATAAVKDGVGGWSLAMVPMFVWYLIQAVPEEAGWRGFALPRLQQRHSALTASLVLGALWGLWHLPLLLTDGTVMATYPIGPYPLEILAVAVIYTWLYNAKHGSLVIPLLFHAAWNTLLEFSTSRVVLTVAIATLLVVRYSPRRLAPVRATIATPEKPQLRPAGDHRRLLRRPRRGPIDQVVMAPAAGGSLRTLPAGSSSPMRLIAARNEFLSVVSEVSDELRVRQQARNHAPR